MKSIVTDPWSSKNYCENKNELVDSGSSFEDSFVPCILNSGELIKLPDSEQYLARLHSRLKTIQGGTSKQDLINSLCNAKEDCIARLIVDGNSLETPEERELAANPLIRHIAPHLQALTANELVHLLKADVLQAVVDEQNQKNENRENKSTYSESEIHNKDNKDSNGIN